MNIYIFDIHILILSFSSHQMALLSNIDQILFVVGIFLSTGIFVYITCEIYTCIRNYYRRQQEKENRLQQLEYKREVMTKFYIHMYKSLYELEQMKAEMHPSEYTARPYYPDPPLNHNINTSIDNNHSSSYYSQPHSHYFTSGCYSSSSSSSSSTINISDVVTYHISDASYEYA